MSENEKSVEVVNYAEDPRISKGTREFLKVLNSPAPPQLEKLSPEEARKVLEGARLRLMSITRELKKRKKRSTPTDLK